MADQTFSVDCGFFNAVDMDRLYDAEQMCLPYNRIVSDGVFATPQGTPSTDLQTVSAENGMDIIVQAGQGMFANKWYKNPSGITITVPLNTSINPRIDSVIAQVDTRMIGRVGNIVYRTGEPAASPTPPNIGTVEGVVEYRLANVAVAAGAAAITNADITDLRGSAECLWVTGLIKQVDTSTLFQQYQAAYQNFFEESTSEFEQYKEAVEDDWDEFVSQLTQQLTATMNLMILTNSVNTASTVSSVNIGISGFSKSTDILLVFINGLFAYPGTVYTVNSAGTAITLTTALPAGNKVLFVALKSVLTGDLQSVNTLIQAMQNEINTLKADTGWLTLPLDNAISAGDVTPEYRLKGGAVYLHGTASGVDAAEEVIGTLPNGYRPAVDTFISAVAYDDSAISGQIVLKVAAATGEISVQACESNLSTSDTIALDMTFSIG